MHNVSDNDLANKLDNLFSCRSDHNLDTALISLVPLPCGSSRFNTSLSSVYRASGPVVYNLTVTASHLTTHAGQLVELVATVHSVASLLMPLGRCNF